MTAHILLVEDEPGIREGLASFLRLKGYRVVAADSCESGLRSLSEEEFDLVVSDWHLGDGLGARIIESCDCPAIVISGVTERVEVPGATLEVIRKPVLPKALVNKVESLLVEPEPPRSELSTEEMGLPGDARDRVQLIQALVRDRHTNPEVEFRVLDDGAFVSVQFSGPELDAVLRDRLLAVARDVRSVQRPQGCRVEVRFFRDGRCGEEAVTIDPIAPWPDGDGSIVVDFDNAAACSPRRMEELAKMAAVAKSHGRDVRFANVPSWLRLHLEILGRAHAMPNRGVAGPLLPDVLNELWR